MEIEEEVAEVDAVGEDEGAPEDAEVPEEEEGEAPGDAALLAIKPSWNLCFVFQSFPYLELMLLACVFTWSKFVNVLFHKTLCEVPRIVWLNNGFEKPIFNLVFQTFTRWFMKSHIYAPELDSMKIVSVLTKLWMFSSNGR